MAAAAVAHHVADGAEAGRPRDTLHGAPAEEAKPFSAPLYPQRAKLKNALQGEQSIKYLLKNVNFAQEGSVLKLIAPEMTLGMIRAAKGDALILRYARELTPEIENVILEPVSSDGMPEDDGFGDL